MVVDGANPVTTQHLIHGTERECQKMGKVVSENEFEYYAYQSTAD